MGSTPTFSTKLNTQQMSVTIEKSWEEKLSKEFEKSYFKQLVRSVKDSYSKKIIFPKGSEIFRAFDLCNFSSTKVVVLGQDPYHGLGQANGLCFSVNPGINLPPSLKNIFKELESDIGQSCKKQGDLSSWAKQGVLLLNSTLTVEKGMAGSHQNIGWEKFTDMVISILSKEKSRLVFILWGAYAQKKGDHIDKNKHCIISSPHPSPFSARGGFFGSKPFSKTNTYLSKNNKSTINW